MSNHQKILDGLEKMANAEGHRLEIIPMRHRENSAWIVLIKAGRAQVWLSMETFVKHPQVILEPFGEELIKQLKGEI